MTNNTADDISTDIADGIVTVKVPVAPTEDHGVIREAVTTRLKEMFDITSPEQLADHVLYCLPRDTQGWIGYAYLDHWLSVYNDEWCNSLSVKMRK